MQTYNKGSRGGGGMNGATSQTGKGYRGLAGAGVSNAMRDKGGLMADKKGKANSGVAALRSGEVVNPTGKRTRPL